jgi:hypothetical protein
MSDTMDYAQGVRDTVTYLSEVYGEGIYETDVLDVLEDAKWSYTVESDWTAHYYATMKHWPEHCTFCARDEGK